MKRAFALILAVMMLFVGASCNKAADVADDLPLDELAVKDGIEQKYYRFDIDKQQPSKNLDILCSGRWEYDFDGCSYVLRMHDNGEFINYCACGSPAGYSDLVEYYLYDDKTGTLYLYDCDKVYVGKGEVTEIHETEVTIKKYGETCAYKLVE